MALWVLSIFAVHLPLAVGTVITEDITAAADKSFDYIVAGAGLSGLTVANKLSGLGHSVLVIEAGPDLSWDKVVYNAEDRPFPSTVCNWQYPAYFENGTQQSRSVDSGACIGGSTSINGMVWYRPTQDEVNQLESLGNPSWNWAALEPYMTAAERSIPPDSAQVGQGAGYDAAAHGHSGFINTSFPTPMRIPDTVRLFKQALPLVFPGLVVGNDLSNRSNVVSASTSWTIWYDAITGKNRRSSAADGFLWASSQQRSTLTILANTTVAKIEFDENMTATAVEFLPTKPTGMASSRLFRAIATKSVILAAGSLRTAGILERSGIGRADVLQAAGVKQLVNLPGVGCNLNDQPGTGVSALVTKAYQNDTSIIDNRSLFGPEISLINVDEVWGTDASIQINSITSPGAFASRAQSLVNAGAAADVHGAEELLNVTINLISKYRMPVVELLSDSFGTVIEAIFWPLLPLSRGHVHINASDPRAPPHIVPRFLSDDFDAAVAVAITRRARALLASQPLAGVVADAYYDPPIAPDASDEEYLAWYRETAYGASHWIGSTAMMRREWGGVVDERLRVYGTCNLHVVDAGLLPFQITSHLMSMVYAMAGRAADIILEDT